jgi:peptidyl-tRNA hydrolase
MKRSKLDIIKSVVSDHQYTKISMLLGTTRKKVILDVQTANLLLKLFQNAPQENISKLEALPWDRLCNLAWGVKE